ncbi:hypothetical protein FSP39_007516 [Pinctada imbricata]|uniref:Histone deacetylase domain-containing protein n=1 Tax=Pinctada imbricata TaxID=66713 RepID=A0AA88YC44_PINIB|nr:hypothetical protein FSP39_007516 [Pinctada imbricata]
MASHFHIWNEDFTEKPERFIKTIERCKEYGLIDRCHRIPSRFSTEAEMLSLHTKEHVEILKQTASMCKEDMEKLSQKYDYLYFHNVQNGMAIIRPPGHHAMENEFNGYCYLNNVAIAAKLAIEKYKVQRVLILDWDVHHGQGIQYSFYNDPRVLYISIHKYLYGEEWPYLRESDFDYIGEGQGRGFNINIPLNEIGCDNSSYMAIFFNIVLPIVYEYNPDLVLVSAGYDAALGCPEGEMEVTPACFAHFVNLLSPLAGGKLCLVLEGGYCIKTLAEGVALSLGALLGDPCPRIGHIGAPHKSVWETILNVIKVLRPYWNSLRYQGNMTSLSDPQYPELLYWPPKAGVKFYTHDKPDTFSLDQDCFNPEYHEVVAELKERVDKMIQDTTFHKAKHKVCVVYDEHMLLHKDNHNGGYEECPERIQDIYDALHKNGLWQRCLEVKGRMATDDELSLVHGVSYLQQFRRAMSLGEEALLQYQSSFKSVYLCKDSYTAAGWAVGCTLSVVDSVMRGEVSYYTNVQILIVDWDIHHGNALQSQFYDDTSVLYVSLHRFDQGSFYPYGGEGYHKCVGGKKAQGFNVNIAWNDGSKGDGDYISAFHHLVLPLAYEFDPELVFVAAGFDAVQGDELHGGYSLTPAVYGHMTRSLMGFSEGKVILVLEGGYNLKSTSESMSVCVSSLLGDSLPQLPSIVPSQRLVSNCILN